MGVETNGGDDDGWGKLLTRPPELSGNPVSRDIWERVGGMDEGVRILHIQYLRQQICMGAWDLPLYFPSEERCAADFYRP
jgi:hypothetical protein